MAEQTPTALDLTANDQFKNKNGSWTAASLILAVMGHFALFGFVKPFQAADLGVLDKEMEAINLPPEVKIPPPPEQIARPATPKVASVEVSEDVTIAPSTFDANPVENLPPPPKSGGSPADRPSFIPYDTPPKLLNTEEIKDLLVKEYPPQLEEAGVNSRVELWIYVDRDGRVENAQVKTSSGNAQVDDAALRIADKMRFKPAMNRDKRTDVWVSQWIQFALR